MKAREVVSRIEALDGYFVRQSGSHAMYRATVGGVTCTTTVSRHSGDIPKGTLAAIQRDMAPVFGKGWLK